VRLVYTAHDAGILACRKDKLDEYLPVVTQIITRPIRIGNRDVSFPADVHVVYPQEAQ
jgi:hypothetical protein